MHKVVFVLGPPGCGKGTQCKRIAETFNFRHLSAGDLLREERQREGSQFGKLIEEHIQNGTIVPVEITCKLLDNAMIATQPPPAGFLIDGFPRNEDNNEGWIREMEGKSLTCFVLFITCPDATAVERCLNRGQGRSDDNEESLKKRLKGYRESTMPIINKYRAKQLVREVDGARSPDEVNGEINRIFEAAGFHRVS